MKKRALVVLAAAVLGGRLGEVVRGRGGAGEGGGDGGPAWLALVDAGKYGESWDAAAARVPTGA